MCDSGIEQWQRNERRGEPNIALWKGLRLGRGHPGSGMPLLPSPTM